MCIARRRETASEMEMAIREERRLEESEARRAGVWTSAPGPDGAPWAAMPVREDPDTGRPGRQGLFAATQWSLVLRARDQSTLALNTLFTQYREPLLIYLVVRGESRDRAEDLVQGFCQCLLRRNFLANVAPEKGRFRTFLLTAFQHYLVDQHEKDCAGIRGGGQEHVSLDETNEEGQPLYNPAAPGTTPDRAYDRAWAQTVLSRALERLAWESAATGHTPLLEALEPNLFAEETSRSYREIAGRLGLSEAAVKMAACRLRARLGGLIREEILQTVASEADWEQELQYLIGQFQR